VASAIASPRPDAPTSFDAILNTNQEVELRWTTNPATYIDKLQLSRYILNQTSGYQWYRDFTSSEYDYFDHNITQGAEIRYKLQIVNTVGVSNPLYDIVKIPYRNPSVNSSIRVKRIRCSDNLEGWLKGDPEILITVYGVDGEHKTTEITSKMMYVKDCNKAFDQWLFEWKPTIWYDRYTFHVVEDDGSVFDGEADELKITANIGIKRKIGENMELTSEAGITQSFKYNNPEDIGCVDLSFYDPIDITLYFSKGNYWCNVTLGQ
jgi:hypothetical protein